MLVILILLFLLVIVCLYYFENWKPQVFPEGLKLPRFQSHRGYWRGGVQENTLQAFRLAKAKGAMMLEFDVIEMSGAQPIIFHDDNLLRLGKRDDLVIYQNASSMKTYANAPTLDELLHDSEIPHFLNLEIKSNSLIDNGFEYHIAQQIIRSGQVHRFIFSSFNPLALRRIAKYLPEVPRALLVTARPGDKDAKFYLRRFWLGGFAKCHLLHLDDQMVDQPMIMKLRNRKIPFSVWTVNRKNRAEELLQLGAMSIISDEILSDLN